MPGLAAPRSPRLEPAYAQKRYGGTTCVVEVEPGLACGKPVHAAGRCLRHIELVPVVDSTRETERPDMKRPAKWKGRRGGR
jgi:hypothetical protein